MQLAKNFDDLFGWVIAMDKKVAALEQEVQKLRQGARCLTEKVDLLSNEVHIELATAREDVVNLQQTAVCDPRGDVVSLADYLQAQYPEEFSF